MTGYREFRALNPALWTHKSPKTGDLRSSASHKTPGCLASQTWSGDFCLKIWRRNTRLFMKQICPWCNNLAVDDTSKLHIVTMHFVKNMSSQWEMLMFWRLVVLMLSLLQFCLFWSLFVAMMFLPLFLWKVLWRSYNSKNKKVLGKMLNISLQGSQINCFGLLGFHMFYLWWWSSQSALSSLDIDWMKSHF